MTDPTTPVLAYVAGPFRGDVGKNVARARETGRRMARLAHQGGKEIYPVIPHTMYAAYVECADEYWLDGTMCLLERCDALVLVNGPSDLTASDGTCAEVQRAYDLGIPIFPYFDQLFAAYRRRELPCQNPANS